MKAEHIVSALVLRHYSEWWLGVASDECRDHCTYADPVDCTTNANLEIDKRYGSFVSALVLRHYSEWWLGVASDECRDHCTYADPVNSTRVNRDYGFCGPCPPDKLSSSAWQLIDLAAHISPERPFLINIGATSTVGGGQ
ncbi:unnamed protein product [Rotaria socialis]|uniref:Uncharacterized protein n=1 Tax=Rotaria socialis TaxID=392032 RepID=A0A820UB52_9BILA|nr:unnamed protein product [Rotaria socialis]